MLATNIRQDVLLVNQKCCICRVPNNPLDVRDVYAPKIVSIGPLHPEIKLGQGRHLEHLKYCYLRLFLELNREMKVEDYIEALCNLEGKTRKCYGEQILSQSNDFAQMHLVDGCFIIMLFLKFKGELQGSIVDSIDAGLLNAIRYELLLFENQIPFFILQCLFDKAKVINKGSSLVNLAINFFNPIIPGHKEINSTDCVDVKHLLDLIRHCYAPSLAEIMPLEDDSPMELEYGAWGLQHENGVRFKKSNKAKSLLDIQFRYDGVMEIPPLKIEMFAIFLNFIAYEQHCGGSDRYISDYVSLMAILLKNPWDASILMKSGIYYYPDPFTVYNIITFLSNKCTLQKTHYSRICKKVKQHCDSTWRIRLASFWHGVLSFPQVIPLGFAVILVVWFVKYLFSF